MAKACHYDERLFTALASSAVRCIEDFNVQDLVNTAWAYAKVGLCDTRLFQAAARSISGHRLDDLSAVHIANIAYAAARLKSLSFSPAREPAVDGCVEGGGIGASVLPDVARGYRRAARTSTGLLCDSRVSAPCRSRWAFSKAGQPDAQLFTALARSAERRAGDFSAPDLANVAWSFANADQVDAQLFASLARSAGQLLDEFDDEELDNAEWAFVRAGQQNIVKHLRQRRKRNLSGAAVRPLADASGCGRIVVAGGGIGGAAVAVALQSKGFDVVVLEADASFDARKQGYGLTIQRQDATHAMGIDLARDDAPSTSHYTFSADGHILGFYGEAFGSKSKDRQEAKNSGRFVHIPRQMLRGRIVEQIQPGTIMWNSRLKSFSCWSEDNARRENGVTVTLLDGTTLDAALLIGADGIFSSVRRQLDLPGDRLNYVGLIVVLGIVPTTVPLTRRRIFETVDGTTRIYAMPFTTSSTMWQLSFPYVEEAARALVKDAAALKAEILRRCGKWHEPVPALLRDTPLDCMSGYPVYDRELLEPDVLRMPQTAVAAHTQPTPQRRVTLIGDAAHPMTPFKAQGANQALSDAVLLADSLAESVQKHGPCAGLDAALPIFERKMLSRSARMVVGSREKAKELHSALALQPSRKVQREAGIDMQRVVRDLRARGIGANNAADPSGLDAVVAAAIEQSNAGLECPSGQHVSSAAAVDEKHRKEHSSVSDPKKRRREAITSDGSKCPRDGSSDVQSTPDQVFGICAQLQPPNPRPSRPCKCPL